MKKELIEMILEERRKKAEEKLAKAKIYTNCLISELENKLNENIDIIEYFDTIYGPAVQLEIGDVQVTVYPFEEKDKFTVYYEGTNWRINDTLQLYYLIDGLL